MSDIFFINRRERRGHREKRGDWASDGQIVKNYFTNYYTSRAIATSAIESKKLQLVLLLIGLYPKIN
ncbi:hypothetical protein QUB43_10885 [Microcoleus sp. A6-D4]